MSRFFRRKKKDKLDEPKEKPVVEEDSLYRICKKYGRPDLYEPLSWVLLLEPRGRDVESLLSEGSSLSYSTVANVRMYEGNPEGAKESFEKTIELGATRKEHYESVAKSIDVATKIGMDWWKEEGKYEELKEKGK